MRRMLGIAIAAVLLALAGAAWADDDTFPAGSETATKGAVSATLAWDEHEDSPGNPRLTITRNGVVAPTIAAGDVVCSECGLSDDLRGDIKVADLDGDGEGEVIVQGVAGIVSGFFNLGIYDYRPATGTYGKLVVRYPITLEPRVDSEIRDLDHDGTYEIIGADSRFARRLGSRVVDWFPPKILRYVRAAGADPKLVDVTRRFPGPTRSDAALALWSFLHPDGGDLGASDDGVLDRGMMADYVADEYLLGHGSAAVRVLDRQLARHRLGPPQSARHFRVRLLALLREFGYR